MLKKINNTGYRKTKVERPQFQSYPFPGIVTTVFPTSHTSLTKRPLGGTDFPKMPGDRAQKKIIKEK